MLEKLCSDQVEEDSEEGEIHSEGHGDNVKIISNEFESVDEEQPIIDEEENDDQLGSNNSQATT